MSLFGTGTPNYGALLQGHEQRRRGFINLGLNQINAVYGGGSAPFYSQARTPGSSFDPRGEYYRINSRGGFNRYRPTGQDNQSSTGRLAGVGTAIGSPMPFLAPVFGKIGGRLFGEQKSAREVAEDEWKARHLFTGGQTQSFEGFQPSFYDERAKAYENYALPQLADQYQLNRDAINYGLSNRGLGQSSIADRASRQLERATGEGRQQIADSAIGQANQLRRDVEGSRQEVIRQLYQSADPAQGLQSAISSAASLRGPSTFAPLNDLFTNLAKAYYVNQTLNNYRQGAGGAVYGNTGYGLSAPVSGPVSY